MTITSIQVTAGRTFNHPHESYSNLRPSVTMYATLDSADDPIAAPRQLQAKAESLVEDHKRQLLQSIEELHEMTEARAELTNVEDQLRRLQSRTEELRKLHPELKLLNDGDQSNPTDPSEAQ
jgi:hypothetical protein